MERVLWMVMGGALFACGALFGGNGKTVEASGAAIDPTSRSIVTSSEDGSRVYVWDDLRRTGGDEAFVREYHIGRDPDTGAYGAFSRRHTITGLEPKRRGLGEFKAALHDVTEAMRVLEEIGDTDTDLYRALAEESKKYAREIAERTRGAR